MTLTLSNKDHEMLRGDHGAATKMAMSILVRMAKVANANELIDITSAHIDSTVYIGDAGLEFAERLASLDAKVDDTQEVLSQCQPEDFLKYGLIPELVGRLPVVASLDELTEEELQRILVEPKNALVKQFQKLFEYEKIRLTFTDEALRAVAKEASRRKTGARGLRSILEEVMLDSMFEIPSRADLSECTIDEEVILGKKSPVLVGERRAS